jgi:peptide/nickel transport system permease protein
MGVTNPVDDQPSDERLSLPIGGWIAFGVLGVMLLAAIVGPMVLQRGVNDQRIVDALYTPGQGHGLLGTDELGRDLLVRLLVGLRISFAVAAIAMAIQLLIGTPLGMVAGYFRGPVDAIVMRASEAAFALPFYLLAIVLGSTIRAFASDGSGPVASFIARLNERTSGLLGVLVALAVVFTPLQARLVRSYVLEVSNRDFVRAARAASCSHWRILRRHIAPHIAGPAIVLAFLNVPIAIVVEAGVSILGLGVAPPTPSLGALLQSGGAYVTTFPHLLIVPAVTLGLMVLSVNALADALQVAGDPKRKKFVAPVSTPPVASSAYTQDALLALDDVRVTFPSANGPVDVVKGVSLRVRASQRLAIVGESGSGKTMLVRSIVGLIAQPGVVTAGSIRFDGHELRAMDERRLNRVRGGEIAMVFQDPLASLDPLRSIGRQVADVAFAHGAPNRRVARVRAVELLSEVGLPEPARAARRLPHELSGGQRQRAMLAIALAGDPRILIADEPTTALDVTIQAQILELLVRRCSERQLALILITHDLALVSEYCEDIVVMKDGVIVEALPASHLAEHAQHGYTQRLVAAVPTLEMAEP